MFPRSLLPAIFTLNCALAFPVNTTSISSIYTDLSSAKCKTTKIEKETGSSVQKCTGVAGYSLLCWMMMPDNP